MTFPSPLDQGAVLSAFFWGYTMTQVLGGYLSDKIGGDVVLVTAAVFWSLLTFWTPQIIQLVPDSGTALGIVVMSRILVGCCQGTEAEFVSHHSYQILDS